MKLILTLSYYLVNTVAESFKITVHMSVLNAFTALHPRLSTLNLTYTYITTAVSLIPCTFKADSLT